MKLKILFFLVLALLLITGVALGMPQIGHFPPFPEPAAMLLVGICLVGIASLARRMFS